MLGKVSNLNFCLKMARKEKEKAEEVTHIMVFIDT
jgi:hypothetical protein